MSDLGRNLGGEFVIQGSLQRSDDLVRVTAQLLRSKDGTVLWAERYERKIAPAEIFSVQQDIAAKVVVAIASISAGVIAQDRLGHTRRSRGAGRIERLCGSAQNAAPAELVQSHSSHDAGLR